MTGKVFTKLFLSFVVVLFVGLAVLGFSLAPGPGSVAARSGCGALQEEARLLAADLSVAGSPSREFLKRTAEQAASAAGAEISIFDQQGQIVASSHPNQEDQPNVPEVARFSSNINP